MSSILKTLFLTKNRNKYITSKDIKDNIYPDLVSLQTGSGSNQSWSRYESTSNIIGWAAGATKTINYTKIGKLLFVQYYFTGTSDSTAVSFTLPYTASGTQGFPTAFLTDNNIPLTTNGYTSIVDGTSHVDVYSTGAGGAWTAANLKVVIGAFFIKIN